MMGREKNMFLLSRRTSIRMFTEVSVQSIDESVFHLDVTRRPHFHLTDLRYIHFRCEFATICKRKGYSHLAIARAHMKGRGVASKSIVRHVSFEQPH